jgi:hypothetical protein
MNDLSPLFDLITTEFFITLRTKRIDYNFNWFRLYEPVEIINGMFLTTVIRKINYSIRGGETIDRLRRLNDEYVQDRIYDYEYIKRLSEYICQQIINEIHNEMLLIPSNINHKDIYFGFHKLIPSPIICDPHNFDPIQGIMIQYLKKYILPSSIWDFEDPNYPFGMKEYHNKYLIKKPKKFKI